MLRKNKNETEEQYLWRIGELKSSGELSESWEEIAGTLNEELYGTRYEYYKGSSAYRKAYQNAKRFYDAGVFETDDSHIARIKEAQDDLVKERRRLYDQRREYNKLLTADARDEHLRDEIINVAKNLANEKPLGFTPMFYPENSEKEALLLFSDWHYGMVTDNIWNKFNPDICKTRVEALVEYTKQFLKINKISTLHIVLLGDAAHGAIHTGCRVQSNEDVCDQIMHVSELIAEAISSLSSTVNVVKVYSCYGNHLRTVQNKNDSIHSDNMEKLIPWWLKERLSDNPKVTIYQSPYKEFTRLNILGSEICCVHGDLENFKTLGTTINTIFTRLYGESIDYTISGDKHHLEEFEAFGIESILVRSLCGTDEYANNKRLYSEAGQTLIIFNDDYGRECTYHIPLNIN